MTLLNIDGNTPGELIIQHETLLSRKLLRLKIQLRPLFPLQSSKRSAELFPLQTVGFLDHSPAPDRKYYLGAKLEDGTQD